MTLSEWEDQYRKPKMSKELAHASRLPFQSGDGYSFGGGAVVTIGPVSMLVGEGDGSFELAAEIARRWNHASNVCEHKFGEAIRLPGGGFNMVCQKCALVAHSDLNI